MQATNIRYSIIMSRIRVVGFTNSISDDKCRDGSYMLAFSNGNSIKLSWYSNFANSRWTDKSNIIIADELAFAGPYGSRIVQKIKDWCNDRNKKFFAISTPLVKNDAFGLLYNTLPDDHKMTITVYDYEDNLQNFNSDEVKRYIGEKSFDQEYLCKV